MLFGEWSDFNSKLGKPEIRTIGRERFGSSYIKGIKKKVLIGVSTIFPSRLFKHLFESHCATLVQGLLYLDGRNSQNYLHQNQADL